jgi:hypothetical protein
LPPSIPSSDSECESYEGSDAENILSESDGEDGNPTDDVEDLEDFDASTIKATMDAEVNYVCINPW